MLLSSGEARKRGCYADETGEDWSWIRALAAGDAVGVDYRRRPRARGRLGPRFVLALGSSARAVAGTRRGRDAVTARLAHDAHETRAERAAAQLAPPADGREIVRVARLPVKRPDGDGGGHGRESRGLRRVQHSSREPRQALGRRNRSAAHGLARTRRELSRTLLQFRQRHYRAATRRAHQQRFRHDGYLGRRPIRRGAETRGAPGRRLLRVVPDAGRIRHKHGEDSRLCGRLRTRQRAYRIGTDSALPYLVVPPAGGAG